MAASSIRRPRLSAMIPIPEHRRAKVCDSSFLSDTDSAGVSSSAEGKPNSPGYGKKMMQPLTKLKKALAKMVVTEEGENTPLNSYQNSPREFYAGDAHWPATFSMGMGMVPMSSFA